MSDPGKPLRRSGLRAVPAGVWTLGFVSMFMDVSSEMIHSLLPVFLVTGLGASVALVGIGGTNDGCTMVRSGCFSLAEIARLRDQGAVGDVLGNYVDVAGNLIASPHSSRLIALSIDDLRRIDTVIAVVSGAEKPLAILGVLRAHVIDVLVVDEANARAVLDVATEAAGDRSTRERTPNIVAMS